MTRTDIRLPRPVNGQRIRAADESLIRNTTPDEQTD